MGFHKIKEFAEAFFEFGSGFGVVFDLPVILFGDGVIDFFDKGLP